MKMASTYCPAGGLHATVTLQKSTLHLDRKRLETAKLKSDIKCLLRDDHSQPHDYIMYQFGVL